MEDTKPKERREKRERQKEHYACRQTDDDYLLECHQLFDELLQLFPFDQCCTPAFSTTSAQSGFSEPFSARHHNTQCFSVLSQSSSLSFFSFLFSFYYLLVVLLWDYNQQSSVSILTTGLHHLMFHQCTETGYSIGQLTVTT